MIEGRSIDFRAVEDEDANTFYNWFNDPEVTRFLHVPFPTISLAEERAIVERLRDNKDQHTFAIVLKDGALIGTCALRNFNWSARSAEIGIVIGEKAQWGKGYGGDAVDLLLTIAFQSLNLHKVWLTCATYNERGLRAYSRLGFREDGRMRDDRFMDGRYHDTVVMSILEDEWRNRRAEPATAAEQPAAQEPATEQITTPERATEQPEVEAADIEPAPQVPARAQSNGKPTFTLTLQKTYYNQGFFNVPADIDDQVRDAEGPIELLLGDADQPIVGRLDRKTNPNGTARVFGGSKLRKWFMANFQLLETVLVEIDSEDLLRLHATDATPREE